MKHEFYWENNNHNYRKNISLVFEGTNSENTAMANTVGLPLYVTAKLLLENKLHIKGGIHIPTSDKLYIPILKELEKYGIIFENSI